MDEEKYTIPRALNLPPGQDYKLLKREGIDFLQQLSGDIWTDYNPHDPGVTILEQLCYALTELSYKASLDIVDLLCAKAQNPLVPQDNAFFPAQHIFPSRPYTLLDYRRLLIDRLYPHILNAWLIPLEKSQHGINMEGLYSVQLLPNEASSLSHDKIRELALKVLHRNRNLCEDYDEVRVLQPLKLVVTADIDLHPNAMGETVMAQVLFEIATQLTPPVRFQNLEELLEEEGMTPDEIFNGPTPKHGFVNKEDLHNSGIHTLRNCPQIPDLTQVLLGIDGIEDVRDLDLGVHLAGKTPPAGYQFIKRFQKNDTLYSLIPADQELKMGQMLLEDNEYPPLGFIPLEVGYEIPEGFYPILQADTILESNLISFFVDELAYEMDTDMTGKNLAVLKAQELQQYQSELKYDPSLPTSTVQASEIETYFSIQNHFPPVYGVGAYGVSGKASRERKVYAKQLKAYLLLMEQHMANYLSQLTNFYKLFSLQDDIPQSYFYQIPDIPNAQYVLGEKDAREDFEIRFKDLNQNFDPVDKRRNRAMDHLLARFGEEFLSETYNSLNRKAVSVDQRKFGEQLLHAKLKFLRNIEELSSNRGAGMDYSRPVFRSGEDPGEEQENVSTLKKRTTLFFNISDYGHRRLGDEVKEDKDVEVSLGKSGGGKKDKRKHFTFSAKGRDIVPDILTRGLDRDNYFIRRAEGKKGGYTVIFKFAEEDSEAFEEWEVFTGENEDECELAILFLIKKLRNLNNRTEGFHLIEHQLLRPVSPSSHHVLLISQGKVAMQSLTPVEQHGDEDWIEKLLKFGKKAANFKIVDEAPPASGPGSRKGRKKYQIHLQDKEDNVIAFKGGFTSKVSAEKEKKVLHNYLKEASEESLKRQITRDEIIPEGALIEDDFYSLTVSAVLPAWPARFRNNKIRSLFEQIIRSNSPAHLAVKCHWVGLEKMVDFERVYEKWQNEKIKPQPNYPLLDRTAYCLMILLRYFDDPTDELAEQELKVLKAEFDLAIEAGKR